jgi:hypothetical protein
MRCVTIVVAAICMSTIPAVAHWQFTQWDMSPDQVVAASHGTAHAVNGTAGERVANADLRAENTYSANGYDFKSQFFFDVSNRLRVVKLNLLDLSRCDQFVSDVEGLYGRPAGGSSDSSEFWYDKKNQNVVRLTHFDNFGICFVDYSPIESTGGNGL